MKKKKKKIKKKKKEKKGWSGKIPNTIDHKTSWGNFVCNRKTAEPSTSKSSENVCGNMAFNVFRRDQDLVFSCTRCRRRYRAALMGDGQEGLVYTAEKIKIKKWKRKQWDKKEIEKKLKEKKKRKKRSDVGKKRKKK